MKYMYNILFPALILCACNTEHEKAGIRFPEDCRAVIDVTKAPYLADNKGRTDCSDALIRAYTDYMRIVQEAYQPAWLDTLEGEERLAAAWDLRLSEVPRSKILYFPDGVYRVSKSIVYDIPDLQKPGGTEINQQIHFCGQSEKGTIIRLEDNSPGFGRGQSKPVLSFIRAAELDGENFEQLAELPPGELHSLRGLHSNIAFSNNFENFTIDIGAGNPGAVGLLFHSSNSGAVRNVCIRSSDPEQEGNTGLALMMGKPMGPYGKNITIEGFDYGIRINDFMLYSVFEHVRLLNQKKAGIWLKDLPVSIRDLESRNRVPAVQMAGERGHLVLVDANLDGGDAENPAIELNKGFLFARNVKTDGYRHVIANPDSVYFPDNNIGEFSSHGMQSAFGQGPLGSLNLEVEETPEIPWHGEADEWASVNSFGAKGDMETDDTRAIQAALNSGKKVVYFQPGRYLVDSTISIPPTVERLNFMFCDILNGENLRGMKDKGVFRVTGESDTPLIIEDLFAYKSLEGEFYFIDHASRRTLIISDVHTQRAAQYINSVEGGRVFFENSCCTVGKETIKDNCYTFRGQEVWARQLNPERALKEVINEGGTLWVLGFKTEMRGTSFITTGGGKTEVLGGVVNNFSGHGELCPVILNRDSHVSFTASTNGRSSEGSYFTTIVEETRAGETRRLKHTQFPQRYEMQRVIPLYTGYSGNPGIK